MQVNGYGTSWLHTTKSSKSTVTGNEAVNKQEEPGDFFDILGNAKNNLGSIELHQGRSTSGVLGLAISASGAGMSAWYDESSTIENPIIKVRMDGGEEQTVSVKDVDVENATEVEMFALCSYLDEQRGSVGKSDGVWHNYNYLKYKAGESEEDKEELSDYMQLIADYKKEIFEKVKNNEAEEKIVTGGNAYTQSEWQKIMDHVDEQIEDVQEEQEERAEKQEKRAVAQRQTKRSEAQQIYEAVTSGKTPAMDIPHKNANVPYGELAQDGLIIYNGVVFVCDEKTNSICLGDMSDKSKVLNIPLSGGGCLKVNRDNIGDLSACVEMFSPEDLNLILRAIAQDTKVQQMQQEKDDMENKTLL